MGAFAVFFYTCLYASYFVSQEDLINVNFV